MCGRETQEWISGQKPVPEPNFLAGRSAVVWAREYSTDAQRCDCNALQQALSKIPGAKRMVSDHIVLDREFRVPSKSGMNLESRCFLPAVLYHTTADISCFVVSATHGCQSSPAD